MLLFVLLQGVAVAYAAAYARHCIKRRRALGAAGAVMLCTAGAVMALLLYAYVI